MRFSDKKPIIMYQKPTESLFDNVRWRSLALRLFFLLFPFFLTQTVKCQTEYIESYEDYILVRTGITNRSLNLNLSPRENGLTKYLERLWYRPNVSSTLGLGVRFKGFGISYAFEIIDDPLIGGLTNKSKYTDIRINSLGRKVGYDINYQDYQGFFRSNFDINGLGNLFKSIKNLGSQDSVFTKDDLRIRNYSANVYYVFKPEKFSYRTAFIFDERQLKSGGSFLVNGSINLTKISTDSIIVPNNIEIDFHPSALYSNVNFYTLSIAPGYAYNFIYKEKFYTSLGVSAMAGLAFFEGERDNSNSRFFRPSLNGVARLSLGYHGPLCIIGASFTGDFKAVNLPSVQFRTSVLELSFFVAYRIHTNWMKGKKSFFEFGKRKLKN